jgi:hypothetical protein
MTFTEKLDLVIQDGAVNTIHRSAFAEQKRFNLMYMTIHGKTVEERERAAKGYFEMIGMTL